MVTTGNFTENIKRMNDFFVKKFDFISIESPIPSDNTKIEYELHLINRKINIYIDIIKYFNDDDMEFTIRGNSDYLNEFSLYGEYFLNKQNLIDANLHDFIEKVNKEVLEYEEQNFVKHES